MEPDQQRTVASNQSTPIPNATQPADPRLLLPVSEVAAVLGLSTMTVYRRIRSGQWPSGRSGRKHLIPRTFVEGLLAEMRTGAQVNIEAYGASSWPAKTGETA